MISVTIAPRPPNGECSSTVITTFARSATFLTAVSSSGLTQYISSTLAKIPCSFNNAAASNEGRTISPHAIIATSLPSCNTVALSISQGQFSCVYISSTGFLPTRIYAGFSSKRRDSISFFVW